VIIAVIAAGVLAVVCLIGFLVTVGITVPPVLAWGAGLLVSAIAFVRLGMDYLERRHDERLNQQTLNRLQPEPLRSVDPNKGKLP
jgi:hypothetical protein